MKSQGSKRCVATGMGVSGAGSAERADAAQRVPPNLRLSKRQRGLSLIELIVVVAVIGLLTAAVGRAFVAGLTVQTRMTESRERDALEIGFEEQLKDLISSAWLSAEPDELASFFIGGGAGLSFDSNTLTFTAVAQPSQVYMQSDLSFEELNARFGPQAGVSEVSLSMSPVGNAGDRRGLFLRIQTPADADPTQGGYERLLHGDIETIEFEFFDGLGWVTSWDTFAQAEPRLPSAVTVTYTLGSSPDRLRTFVAKLPFSDVTPQDPAGVFGVIP